MGKRIELSRFYVTSDRGQMGDFWWSNADTQPIELANGDGTVRKYWKEGICGYKMGNNCFFFTGPWIYWKIRDRVTYFFHLLNKT